jgi:hypothetical protein
MGHLNNFQGLIVCRESVKSEVVTRDLGGAAEDDGGHAAKSCKGHRGDATTGAAWRLGSIQVIIARMKSKIRYCCPGVHNVVVCQDPGAGSHVLEPKP